MQNTAQNNDHVFGARKRSTQPAIHVLILTTFLLCLVGVGTTFATGNPVPDWQTPYIIKNIASETEDAFVDLTATTDTYLLFTAQGPVVPDMFSFQLWRTDGTENNTILLEDTPGRVYGQPFYLNGKWIFTVREDEATGKELWVSDGTPGAARLLIELVPGFLDANPENLTLAGPYLYFTATADGLGTQLWRTDGTDAGTMRLTGSDLGTDIEVYLSYGKNPLANHDRDLLFVAFDNVSGSQVLFRSDGTVAGTTEIAVLHLDYAIISNLVESSSLVYWLAGPQLWRSNGTAAGTFLVHDEGPLGEIRWLENATSNLYFLTGDLTLWKTGGTNDSTVMIKQFQGSLGNPVANGALLFFWAQDPAHGVEPWIRDGTEMGTRMLVDTRPGPEDGMQTYVHTPVTAGSMTYFVAYSNIQDDQINATHSVWRTNGTTAGTAEVPLSGLPPDTFPNPKLLTAFKNELFFMASDTAHGSEPWITKNSGTAATFIKDINDRDNADSNPSLFNYVDGNLFFWTSEGLWVTDGSEEGTTLLVANEYNVRQVSQDRKEYGISGAWLYFVVENHIDDQTELWRSNGRPEATAPIYSWAGTHWADPVLEMVGENGILYFVHSKDTVSDELWRTDGKTDGTYPIFGSYEPYYSPFDIRNLTALGGDIYFVVEEDFFGAELWGSDGTSHGTYLVKDIQTQPGVGSDPEDLTASGGILYFTANDGRYGRELWRSNGTGAGTSIVRDIRPGPDSSAPEQLTVFRDGLYFTAAADDDHRVLWRTDGGRDNTTILIDSAYPPRELTPAKDWLYFVGWSEGEGYQPWKTDGSRLGTQQFVSLEYSDFGFPHDLAAVDNTLYFTVRQATSMPVYQSDGTAENTFAHKDRYPDMGGYEYSQLTPAPGRLFFVSPYSYQGAEPAIQVLSLVRSAPDTLHLPDGGIWKNYALTLNLRPSSPVTVNISGTDTVQIGPNEITFTPETWSTSQQVNIRALDGGPNAQTRPATVTHQMESADERFDGETMEMTILIRQWRFGYLPTINR